MCDPLSVAASVVAVAGFAAKSCECLYETLRLFSEAPNDLQHHVNAIQALQSTFAGIVALENDVPDAAIISPELKARLQACMFDLQAMERLAKSFHAQLEEGKARRTWAKMRWSSSHQRHTLIRHLSRVESYHMSFSLDLLLLNIRLGLRHKDEILQIREEHSPPPDTSASGTIGPPCHNGSLYGPQGCYSELVSVRSSFLKHLENNFQRFLFWLGPVTVRQWSNGQSLCPNVLQRSHGYGITLVTASNRYCPFRLELVVYLLRNSKGPSVNLSCHWNFFWPRAVPWDAKIVDLALGGDIDAMKREFSKGNSTPFDVLPDGLTLLHLAASQGRFDMVKFLLQEGARVNAMNDFGETPLHSAIALSKDYDVSRVLVEHGGDLCNRNADGKTPLHTFSSQVSEQILRCHGSLLDFSVRDRRGMSLLHYLAWSSKTSIETFTIYHERSSLDVKTVDAEGRSMLHLSAQRSNVPMIEHLSWAAKDSNINHSDRRGRTALYYGVESKRACHTITALISHGADIWARDCHQRSVMHHASRLGNLPAVKALLALGMADELRAADRFGMTPLEVAAHHKAQPVLAFLAEMKSNLDQSTRLTGLGLVECKELSAAETDGLVGRSLSSPAQSRHDGLAVQPRGVHHWRQKRSPVLEGQQNHLSHSYTYHSLINCLAYIAALGALFGLFCFF